MEEADGRPHKNQPQSLPIPPPHRHPHGPGGRGKENEPKQAPDLDNPLFAWEKSTTKTKEKNQTSFQFTIGRHGHRWWGGGRLVGRDQEEGKEVSPLGASRHGGKSPQNIFDN